MCHSFPIDKYTVAGPVKAVDRYATASDTPGTGVVFDWVALGEISLHQSQLFFWCFLGGRAAGPTTDPISGSYHRPHQEPLI